MTESHLVGWPHSCYPDPRRKISTNSLMTVNRKIISTPAISPAPAINPATDAPKVATKRASSRGAKKSKRAVTAEPISTPVTGAALAPSVVATPSATIAAPKPLVTSITARIDIGFGNSLYLRGEGPGLSWDVGLLMTCVGRDEWQATLAESAGPVVFKFLINDVIWSTGPDQVVQPGTSTTLTPTF